MNSAGENDSGLGRSLRAKDTTVDHLDNLLRALDTSIFLQLAIAYVFDNLSLLLLLRAVTQVLYVQFRPGPLSHTTQLAPTLSSTLICIVTHILHARPEATARSARGYIHGGLIVEFVGELGPIAKWRLLVQDVLVCGLQLLMLAIGYERQVLSQDKKEETPQDIEAEEAGVRRSQDGATDAHGETEQGIEMQSLLPQGSGRTRATAADAQDDLVLTLDIRRSLQGLLKRNKNSQAATAEGSSASDRTERLSALLGRIAADRTAAGT